MNQVQIEKIHNVLLGYRVGLDFEFRLGYFKVNIRDLIQYETDLIKNFLEKNVFELDDRAMRFFEKRLSIVNCSKETPCDCCASLNILKRNEFHPEIVICNVCY